MIKLNPPLLKSQNAATEQQAPAVRTDNSDLLSAFLVVYLCPCFINCNIYLGAICTHLNAQREVHVLSPLAFRKAAPSTSSSPAPPHSSSRSSSRCSKSTTGPPSLWWPPVTTAMRTSWPWWRVWRTVRSLAGKRRVWWFSMWQMTLAAPEPNGCSKTTKPRWGGETQTSICVVLLIYCYFLLDTSVNRLKNNFSCVESYN